MKLKVENFRIEFPEWAMQEQLVFEVNGVTARLDTTAYRDRADFVYLGPDFEKTIPPTDVTFPSDPNPGEPFTKHTLRGITKDEAILRIFKKFYDASMSGKLKIKVGQVIRAD